MKAKINVSKSYHCSPKYFSDSWCHHRALHAQASSAVHENGSEDEKLFGRFGSIGGLVGSTLSTRIQNETLSNGCSLLTPPNFFERGGFEAWYEVGCSKTYTPTTNDVGHALKMECVTVDAATIIPIGLDNSLHTSCVILDPSPTPRQMIPINVVDGIANI